MQVVLIILSAGLLALIIYFAVSPKSSRLLKLAALIALGLIAISIGVCSVFLIKGPAEAEEALPFPVFGAEAEPQKQGAGPAVFIFLAVFLLVIGMITVIALRSQKKQDGAQKNKSGRPIVPGAPGPAFPESKPPLDEIEIDDFDN